MSTRHVVIAGAGVIGLAAALEMAAAGWRVTVLERGRAMEQSSWAAAGMLAVEDPENAPELGPLARLSRSLYPAFLERVEALSGLRVPLRTAWTLQGAALAGTAVTDAGHLLPALRLDRYRFVRLEEASLDPRDLCTALPLAARAAGVELREGTGVAGIEAGEKTVEVRLSQGQSMTADRFVLAAGAWSGQLAGLPPLPVAPRKGQMMEVQLAAGAVLPCVVRTPELYLVPRGDGRVAIGATVEHAGFDRAVDAEAGERLWQAAGALWPPVLEGTITARWTGLRPGYVAGVADALPVIGMLASGVVAATAHFRNGILLAPGTARLVRALLVGERMPVPVERFAPERLFAGVAE